MSNTTMSKADASMRAQIKMAREEVALAEEARPLLDALHRGETVFASAYDRRVRLDALSTVIAQGNAAQRFIESAEVYLLREQIRAAKARLAELGFSE